MEEYLEYLKRYTRVLPITMREAHRHYICREVAREYGVADKGLKLLDQLLNEWTPLEEQGKPCRIASKERVNERY